MKTQIRKENGVNRVITEFNGTGHFWYFDNGQYGERTESIARKEYRLAYHYDRVYISSSTRNNMEGGPLTDSLQAPLSCYINNVEIMKIACMLFEADKKDGIISTEYPFI